MLAEPAVAEWWPGYDADRVAHEYFDEPDDDLTVYAIELDGEVVGLIQSYEESDPEYRHAGIDVSLTTRVHEQGLGSDAVRTLARHLFEHDGHHRLVIDPSASNARAIACYTKVGFRPVGLMREYEADGRGGWRDGLLMDLLRAELT
jgi:aminoglycoside 6'-N-acetyltransferase